MKSHRFDKVETIVLIGGGDLMVTTARAVRGQGQNVVAILAPRHVDEELLLRDGTLGHALAQESVQTFVVEDINAWSGLGAAIGSGGPALALCFGPAWVFSPAVREAFGAGMVNFNGIPIPRYLGGAHFTWQILNDDLSGGCILQEITGHLDRGPILRAEYHELPPTCRIPADYYRENLALSVQFLARAIADMKSGVAFDLEPFDKFEPKRLYYPRLSTVENALIDWSWPAVDVERFIRAFDDPYPGAASFLDGEEIRFSGAQLRPEEGDSHPFTAGLIVRRYKDTAWIAANRGVLSIRGARRADGSDAMALLKEGKRLHTPVASLERALNFRPELGPKGAGGA